MEILVAPDLLWLAHGLLAALLTGLFVAVLAGALLLARPSALFVINQRLSRWIDTREQLSVLDRPHPLERFFYRHHRVLGALLAGGATYVLWRWTFDYQRRVFLASLHRSWTSSWDWVVHGFEWITVLLHVGILVLGLVIMARPSLLKNLERVANRWHALPQIGALDRAFDYIEQGFEAFPRLSGLVVLLAAGWSLLALLPVLAEALGR